MESEHDRLSYHKVADQFLKTYYENNTDGNILYSYPFLSQSATEARQIAKAVDLKGMDLQNAIVSTWFAYAGVNDIFSPRGETSAALLTRFFNEADYPDAARTVVEEAIRTAMGTRYPDTKVQKVVCDALNSRLAWPNFIENIILLKEETNRLTNSYKSQLFYLKYCMDLFLKKRYYTDFANDRYSERRERNFQMLEKRINKLEATEKAKPSLDSKGPNQEVLSDREAEEIFKIAFRNYNHLISTADSKAALLIRVNSIIISVMLGLVLSRVDKYKFLLMPTILLLVVCLLTIFLSVLASRPQKNFFIEDRSSNSYQKFFFGSFDLIDTSFHKATWDGYYSQLRALFSSSKENIYMEVFKESFNVRKVLSKKFTYLSMAYWVFMVGLFVSIIAFLLILR